MATASGSRGLTHKRGMPTPEEHKPVEARILEYAEIEAYEAVLKKIGHGVVSEYSGDIILISGQVRYFDFFP